MSIRFSAVYTDIVMGVAVHAKMSFHVLPMLEYPLANWTWNIHGLATDSVVEVQITFPNESLAALSTFMCFEAVVSVNVFSEDDP